MEGVTSYAPGCDTSPRANILFGLNEETPRLKSKNEVALLPPSKLAYTFFKCLKSFFLVQKMLIH